MKLLCDVADADTVPMYLETLGAKNEAFYSKKGGLRVATRIIVEAVGGGERLDYAGGVAAMVRDAREETNARSSEDKTER